MISSERDKGGINLKNRVMLESHNYRQWGDLDLVDVEEQYLAALYTAREDYLKNDREAMISFLSDLLCKSKLSVSLITPDSQLHAVKGVVIGTSVFRKDPENTVLVLLEQGIYLFETQQKWSEHFHPTFGVASWQNKKEIQVEEYQYYDYAAEIAIRRELAKVRKVNPNRARTY